MAPVPASGRRLQAEQLERAAIRRRLEDKLRREVIDLGVDADRARRMDLPGLLVAKRVMYVRLMQPGRDDD